MALYPLESGSSLIMSTEITCQHRSGTLLGISFPTFCIGKVFIWLHASHPATNLATYLDNPGHLWFHDRRPGVAALLGATVVYACCQGWPGMRPMRPNNAVAHEVGGE